MARTHAALFRYLRGLLPSDEAAEDALQEVYVAVWRSASAWEGRSRARVWLYGIARNQAARGWRRRAGEPAAPLPIEDLAQVPLGSLAQAAGFGAEMDPEQMASAIEDRERLQNALMQLSPDDREVIWLRDIEGCSGPETAELLGSDLAAVKSRLHRARLRLLVHVRRAEETQRPGNEGGPDG